MTPNNPDNAGDIEIPEEINKWIKDQYLQCADDLAYPQLSFNMGALAMYRKLYPSLKEKEERIAEYEKVCALFEEERSAAKSFMAEDGRLLSEAIEQNRLLIIQVEEKNALLSKGSHDFAALNEIVIEKDKELEGARARNERLQSVAETANGKLVEKDKEIEALKEQLENKSI